MNFKKGSIGQKEAYVMEAMKKSPYAERDIIAKLPKSATAFFCRAIAKRLNDDKMAMDQMREILAGKNYWQANLNKGEWNKGVVSFKFSNSGQASLKIFGNKSATDDIDAKQGMVNYLLS